MKLLTTGNPKHGLTRRIADCFGGDFVHRDIGHDLYDDAVKWLVAERSLLYDVFVNAEPLMMFHQTLLLDTVWQNWRESTGKRGTIVSIGSPDPVGHGSGARWPVEQQALRALSERLDPLAPGIRVVWLDGRDSERALAALAALLEPQTGSLASTSR